ncbi:hypothetical protein [Vibrio algivorus]|uniref:hypothetical protein n=1 Tax=Vibrio algivorus TaxID=1667024 RepID=UPI0016425B93|nr:hypothetical protein [Vibrio algivorus]
MAMNALGVTIFKGEKVETLASYLPKGKAPIDPRAKIMIAIKLNTLVTMTVLFEGVAFDVGDFNCDFEK